MKQVIIDSEGKQCRPIYPECMFVDSTPRKGSMNPISSDAVFNVVGGSTELPSYDESNEGQILKVKDDASGVEWADVPASLPDMAGQDGKILGAVDNSGTMTAQWINPPEELPSVTGNAGKVLTVNSGATGVEWANSPAELPTVTGNAGKILTVNSGATGVEWADAASGVPEAAAADEGKVLGVTDNQGTVGWVAQTPAQVNSDWNAASGAAQILNKPSLATVATSGSYSDLTNKPTIPDAQVNSDWNASSGVSEILHKPDLSVYAQSANLAAVATSGSYNDLQDKPTIPSAYSAGTGIDITSNVISADIDNSTIKTALAPSVIQSARNLNSISGAYGSFIINADVKAKLTQDSSASGSKLKIHIPGNMFSYSGNVSSDNVNVEISNSEYFYSNNTAIYSVALSVTFNSQTQKTYIDEQDIEISCYMADWLNNSSTASTLDPATSSSSTRWFMGFFRMQGTGTSNQAYGASSASLPPAYPVVISEYVAGNKLCVNLPELTTAGISDVQLVNALPASPVATVLYLIAET